LSHGGVRGVRITVVDGSQLSTVTQVCKLEGISTFNNFEFTLNGLTCWKAYNIGCGELFTWKNLNGLYSYTTSVLQYSTWNELDF
jgi:hypothetical protein